MTEKKKYYLKIVWGDKEKTEALEIVLYDGGQPLCRLISVDDARLVRNILNEKEEQIQNLQKRNKNQYQQLTHIWNCIANKDYKTLHDEYTEMEKLEKQLQKEWKCINDKMVDMNPYKTHMRNWYVQLYHRDLNKYLNNPLGKLCKPYYYFPDRHMSLKTLIRWNP